MNAQEGIKAIKALLGLNFSVEPPAETRIALAEATLTDGTIIRYESLEVGQAVIVITAEGEAPAPDGQHELNDGTIVETQGGVITNITEAVTEPTNEDMTNEFKAAIADLQKSISTLTEKMSAIEQSMTESKTDAANKFSAMNKAVIDTLTLVEKFGQVPSAEPISTPVSPNRKSKDEYFAKVAEAIKGLKN